MGFYNALNACFTLHELNHSHTGPRSMKMGTPWPRKTLAYRNWKEAPPIVPAVKDKVRADR